MTHRGWTVPCLCFLLSCSLAAALGAEYRGLYRVTSLRPGLSGEADFSAMLPARVVKVVDGDTIKVSLADPPVGLDIRETVRLIGVDTPETVDRRKTVQRFGREASDYARSRLLGKPVRLAFDRELRDRYGRLLAYVYLEEGRCFDLELVAAGYGSAYVKYPFSFMDEFVRAEREARRLRRGLWAE